MLSDFTSTRPFRDFLRVMRQPLSTGLVTVFLLAATLTCLVDGSQGQEQARSTPAVDTKVRPSVFPILTTGVSASPSSHSSQSGSVSGVNIHRNGYILTLMFGGTYHA